MGGLAAKRSLAGNKLGNRLGNKTVEYDQLEALGLEQPFTAADCLVRGSRPDPEEPVQIFQFTASGENGLCGRARGKGIRKIDPGNEDSLCQAGLLIANSRGLTWAGTPWNPVEDPRGPLSR